MSSKKAVAKQNKMAKPSNSNGGKPSTSIAPVAVSNKQSYPKGGKLQNWRFRNSELVASVVGSVSFAATKYRVNPGLSAVFTWLSSVADRFEQYKFHKLCFRYVTRTATSTVGSVILSPDYAVLDPPPATEQGATNTQGAVEDCAWKEISCNIDIQAAFATGPRKFVRDSNVSGDLSLYDCLNFYLCTTGFADASAIGKLWADYDVELFTPQSSAATTSAYDCNRLTIFKHASDQTLTTATPTTIDWDTPTEGQNALGATEASGSIILPAGTYLVMVNQGIRDSASELLTWTAYLAIDGVPQTYYTGILPATGSVEKGVISFNELISVSSTSQVILAVTLTGAAGTLTAEGTGSSNGGNVLTIMVA